jgi:glycosyltransferase involved in cell wall biosynthesis
MSPNETKLLINIFVPSPRQEIRSNTGGMTRLLEIVRRLSKVKNITIHIIGTKWIIEYFKHNKIKGTYYAMTSSYKWKNIFDLGIYSFWLSIKSYFFIRSSVLPHLQGKKTVYVSSDLFWEVIPAFFWKSIDSSVKWIQVIHHIYPPWYKRPGNMLINFFGFYLQRISFFLISKNADKIIVLNQITCDALCNLGFDKKNIKLSSNAIYIPQIRNIKKATHTYHGVYLGRLSYSKGILDLIQIWKHVCKIKPDSFLGIIGGYDNKIKTRIEREIRIHHLNRNISLLGFKDIAQVYSIMKSSKVFLFPSHEEGWGIAIAEAMACKLPVVAWNLPVYKEVFDTYIIQIKENDIETFAQAILQLLNNPKKRQQIGEAGYRFIQKYSWDNVFKKELQIIQS